MYALAFLGSVSDSIVKPLANAIGSVLKPILEAFANLFMMIFVNSIFAIIVAVIKALFRIIADIFLKLLVDLLVVARTTSDILTRYSFFDSGLDTMKTIGMSLLIIIAAYQITKSYFAYFGFESEEPWKIAIRIATGTTLIMLSYNIAEFVLQFYDHIINVTWNAFGTDVVTFAPDGNIVIDVKNFANALFPTDNWFDFTVIGLGLDVFLFFFIVWKTLRLAFKFAERYVLSLLLVLVSPLAYACCVSTPTRGYFTGWAKIFVGNLTVQFMQILLFTLVLTLPTQPAVTVGGRFGMYFLILGALQLSERLEDIVGAATIQVGLGREMMHSGISEAQQFTSHIASGRFENLVK